MLDLKGTKGESYSRPVDFFNAENKPLRKLPPEDLFHIERHIPNPSYQNFLDSLERQKEVYRKTKKAFTYWEQNSGKARERPASICYPCITCLKIAKKLKES